MTTTHEVRVDSRDATAIQRDQIAALTDLVTQQRRVITELAAAAGIDPAEAMSRGLGLAEHIDCSAALHARELQRRLNGIVFITHQVDVMQPGLVAVAFANIRTTAGGQRQEPSL